MEHNINPVCADFRNRTENTLIEHGKDIGELKVSQAEDRNEVKNICKKMDNLTQALWGLTTSFIVVFIGLIITLITKNI